ncbi:hypothetical protein HMPREF0663_11526 [Hoylesella oralis ATCC 33269]|uniref:Uncharacterized protein n=1 Tax=Hoylesella oralis ATCC 33269 TaxID=873533 RepID=E7RQS5_9BACT|nr:hypothetical protein HMPREF0663_11526 [Hoylesella oralis ATCC 33269]
MYILVTTLHSEVYVYFDGVIVKIEKVYEKIFYINMATSDHRISEKRRWKIFAKVA